MPPPQKNNNNALQEKLLRARAFLVAFLVVVAK